MNARKIEQSHKIFKLTARGYKNLAIIIKQQ